MLFDTLYVGTIPILQKNALVLHPTYSKLPIVYVDNLVDFLSWENISDVLRIWVNEKAPYFETGSFLRNKTLQKFHTKYWYHQMQTHILLFHQKHKHEYHMKLHDNNI